MVWLGWLKLTTLLASGVDPGAIDRIAWFGLARQCSHCGSGVKPGGNQVWLGKLLTALLANVVEPGARPNCMFWLGWLMLTMILATGM